MHIVLAGSHCCCTFVSQHSLPVMPPAAEVHIKDPEYLKELEETQMAEAASDSFSHFCLESNGAGSTIYRL